MGGFIGINTSLCTYNPDPGFKLMWQRAPRLATLHAALSAYLFVCTNLYIYIYMHNVVSKVEWSVSKTNSEKRIKELLLLLLLLLPANIGGGHAGHYC